MDNTNKATDNITNVKNDSSASANVKVDSRVAFRPLALIGLIIAILAWVFLPISGTVSLIAAFIGCVISAFGCRLKPGNMRNVAITGVIASAVLLLVFATFYFAYSLV